MMMAKKTPKPRRGDSVETLNLSRMFGTVKRIVSKGKVKVQWHDKMTPYTRTENIKNLALVRRRR